MAKAKGNGNVQEKLIFPLQHEEGPVQGVSPELPVGSAEVDLVEQAASPIFQDLVGQGGCVGEPELEGGTVEGVLGNAGVDTGALRHGEIHDDVTNGGILLGPGHHRIGPGPLEWVRLDWANDGCML